MKTTIELPDSTFRRAKAHAAGCGITLKRFFTNAVEQQLAKAARRASDDTLENDAPPWMAGFGELADLGDEHRLVLDAIEAEFERLSSDELP